MLLFLVWVVPLLWQGLQVQWHHPEGRLALQTLGGFVGAAIALFLLITYGMGTDLTRGARYNFVYFPAVIILVGASLTPYWSPNPLGETATTDALETSSQLQSRGRRWGVAPH